MITFIIAFAIFALALLGLGLGLLFRRGPVQGSCGGLARLSGLDSDCGGLCQRRERGECPKQAAQATTAEP